MGSHRTDESIPAGRTTQVALTWLGGGDVREIGERHERSAHAIAGLVVLLTALLGAVVAGLALAESTAWHIVIIISLALVAGALVAMVGRAIASGSALSRLDITGRAAVGVAVGVVLGELAAVILFAGASQHVLEEQSAKRADSVPAVAQASAQLDQSRQARSALVDAVEEARRDRDDALVVARCEYNPRPECPQTRITGDPGQGPETQTANGFLADAQQQFDAVTADRDNRLPGLDAQIAQQEQSLAVARQSAISAASPGLGARWVAMNTYTSANPGALMLRLLASTFFIFLSLLPLILKVWRGETTYDRQVAARAEQERAELEADTAIAVKRAEVRAAAEALWAEQQLESARLAVAAQNEIEREQQRQRVLEAVGAVDMPTRVQRLTRSSADRSLTDKSVTDEDESLYLPIAAEAEAASRAMPQLPAAVAKAPNSIPADIEIPTSVETPENLPDRIEEGGRLAFPGIPGIPDVTEAAARWIRPFVPPIVAQAFDVATHPLRSARQVFEEVEEINLTLNRTRKVSVYTEEAVAPGYEAPYYEGQYYQAPSGYEETVAAPVTHTASETTVYPGWAAPAGYGVPPAPQYWSLGSADQPGQIPPGESTPELPGPTGPWQLPPGS